MDKKAKELWDKYDDEFIDRLDDTIEQFKNRVKYLKRIREKAMENKCEVKGCKRRGTNILISHDEDDHRICDTCVDKYFRRDPDEPSK